MYSFAVRQFNGNMLDVTHVNLKLPELLVKKCNSAVLPEFHSVFVKVKVFVPLGLTINLSELKYVKHPCGG
jgi:hypothetical protein